MAIVRRRRLNWPSTRKAVCLRAKLSCLHARSCAHETRPQITFLNEKMVFKCMMDDVVFEITLWKLLLHPFISTMKHEVIVILMLLWTFFNWSNKYKTEYWQRQFHCYRWQGSRINWWQMGWLEWNYYYKQ